MMSYWEGDEAVSSINRLSTWTAEVARWDLMSWIPCCVFMHHFHPILQCSSVCELYNQILEGLENDSEIHRTAHPEHLIIETLDWSTWLIWRKSPLNMKIFIIYANSKNVYPHNSTPHLLAFNLPSDPPKSLINQAIH